VTADKTKCTEPHLGLATTRQLLDELRTRIEVDYVAPPRAKKRGPAPLVERNAEVVRLWREGSNGGEIARKFGLTRQRVEQIIKARAPELAGRGHRKAPCGTLAAYQRHLINGGKPCAVCRTVLHPRVLQPCGTLAAYKRHLMHGEKPCSACRAANTDEHYKRFGKGDRRDSIRSEGGGQ